MEEVPHSIEAIRVSQHIANYFIEMARRSSHVPESKEEELALQIYDTPPIFSARFEVRGWMHGQPGSWTIGSQSVTLLQCDHYGGELPQPDSCMASFIYISQPNSLHKPMSLNT